MRRTRRKRVCRGRRIAALLLGSMLAAGCAGGSGGSSPAEGPATILLVTVDTLRADRLGCYGRRGADTPAFDALAAEGVLFAAAQTTAPLTLPAHASILAGRTVPAHGVLDNGTFALRGEVPLLAESFEAAGWASGAFVSSPVLARRYGLARGFAHYDDAIPKPARETGIVLSYEERSGRETVSRALAWLREQGSRSVLLWVHLWEPHAPYRPPPEQAARHADDPYQGEVAAADAALFELLGGIEALDRNGRLLVVATSDHGEGLGEHGEPTHGVYLYRPTMQIPLVVRGPAWGIGAGRRVDPPVSVADLAPTLLELAGLPPLPGADGYSLAPFFTGRGEAPERPGVLAESHLPRLEFGWSGLRAIVRGETKLIDAPRPELFDLATDPDEEHDLSATSADTVAAVRSAGDDLLRRALAGAPTGSSARAASTEELAQLQALGYAGSGRRTLPSVLVDSAALDPKERVRFLALHDRASELARLGRHEEAIEIFSALVREEPANPSLLLQFGQALIVSGRLDQAVAVFSRAVAVDPGFGMAWYRLGQLLDDRKDTPGAETAYRRAIDADPLAAEPRLALAGLLASQGRRDESAELLDEVLELDPSNEGVRRQAERLRRSRGGTSPD